MEEKFFNSTEESYTKDNSKKNIDEKNTDENNGIVKFRAVHVRDLFPRAPAVLGEGDNTYGITLWTVMEAVEGDVKENFNGEVTVTGTFNYKIQDKLTYIITAKEIVHPKYGVQYQLVYMNMDIDFKNINGQKAFLKVFLTQGQIEEFFKVYDNPLQIIDSHDIEAIKKVHGVGDYIARCIIERYEENKDMSQVYMELDKYNLSSTIISKLIKNYRDGNLLIDVVKNHPYELVKIDGIGFITADKIALQGGMSPRDWERVKAFILYYLKEEGEEGNSFVTAGELLGNIYEFFGGKEEILEEYYDKDGDVCDSNITRAIKNLTKSGEVIIENTPNKSRRRVFLKEYWLLEKKIAYHLRRLMSAENNFKYDDWEEKIKKLEEFQGFTFAEEQLKGIKMGLDNQVCLISGLAGSGKSSLVSGILASLDNYSFAQCALSGKAAARLQEVTGQEGQTIHRLLSYNGVGFLYNREVGLPYDIIVLDEISLVGGRIFLSLLEAIRDGCKLIMLGDMGQLESIGALNLATDIIKGELVPTIELKEIHRQAAKSGIITCSHDIRNQIPVFDKGETGELIYGELEDMVFDVYVDKENIRKSCIEQFKKYWDSDIVKKDIMNVQVLSPVKERGDSCVYNLNLDIQNIVNPVSPWKKKIEVKSSKDKVFYIQENDKVMCIKNNYTTRNRSGQICPIFNGWTGLITNIVDQGIWVDFPLGDEVFIENNEIRRELILGYASTIHKCVTGDTIILTNEGFKRIDEANFDGVQVFNGAYYETPKNYFHNPPADCIKITTERGHSLSGLKEHGVFVYYNTGYKRRKQLKDIKIGDMVRSCVLENGVFVWNYDRIIKVEYIGQHETYCFEMPETHQFIQNGILGSNCQGSDYPLVIGAIDFSTPPLMLTCQLVYTLVTRAKKLCVVVCQSPAILKAISSNYVSTKRTFLPEFLALDYNESDEEKEQYIYQTVRMEGKHHTYDNPEIFASSEEEVEKIERTEEFSNKEILIKEVKNFEERMKELSRRRNKVYEEIYAESSEIQDLKPAVTVEPVVVEEPKTEEPKTEELKEPTKQDKLNSLVEKANKILSLYS